MGRAEREKGKRGERECAAELAGVFRCDARRGVQYQGGHDSPDVVLDGVPVHVEAKRVEKLNLYAAMRQAVDDSNGKTPIVWHRRNNEDSVIIVRTQDVVALAYAITATAQNATADIALSEIPKVLPGLASRAAVGEHVK